MIYDFLYENLNFLYENLRFSQCKIWIIFSMIFLMIHKISFRLTRKFSLTNSCWVCSTLPILDKFRLCCFTPFCSHDVPVGRCQGLHHHWISTVFFSITGLACSHANFYQENWVEDWLNSKKCGNQWVLGNCPYGLWLAASGARRLPLVNNTNFDIWLNGLGVLTAWRLQ